jgi:F0F1-type ATP synthase assembly protein I
MKTSSLIMLVQGIVFGMVADRLVQDQGWGLFLLAAFANPILTILYAHTKTKENK